jgi:hypothetical protein
MDLQSLGDKAVTSRNANSPENFRAYSPQISDVSPYQPDTSGLARGVRTSTTALLDGLAEATTALFLADKASETIQASDSQATQQALREAVANANIAIYRLLSLSRSEAVRAAIDQAIHEVTAFPHLIEAEATRSVVRALSDAVLSEHDALQPIASHPVG